MHYLCKSLCYAFLNRKLNVSVHHASHHTVPGRLQTYNYFLDYSAYSLLKLYFAATNYTFGKLGGAFSFTCLAHNIVEILQGT